MALSREEIAAEIAELTISFPAVAPRVIENLQSDRSLYSGFDTPVLMCIAKHQIPVIMNHLVEIGAYAKDNYRKCGYVAMQNFYTTDGKGKSPAAKAAYFKSYADVVEKKICEGKQNKMAAVSLNVPEEKYKELMDKMWPILKDFIADVGTKGQQDGCKPMNLLFCSVLDDV